MSRDKLVVLFWPDADPERGRHALTQSLYATRRGLRCDDLFLVDGDIRLNPQRIASDVVEFETMLSADPERAVELYRGPFLDGFFLSGSNEFEQWLTLQRARLEESAVRALERLASSAQADGNARRAVDWWRRAAGLRPLDARIAARLMEALVASGDRAGAVQHADIHARLLKDELDLDPDPTVTNLARSLREAAPASRGVVGVERGQKEVGALFVSTERTESKVAIAETDTSGSGARDELGIRATPTVVPYQEVGRWVPNRRRGHAWQFAVLAAVASVLIAIGVAIGRTRHPPSAIRIVAQNQKVVVAPFRVAGAATSLAYLRDGMVELLSTRLADDSAARSVDAGAVIGAWRAAGLAPAMDVPRDTVVRIAGRLGAERVVVGGVVGTAEHVVLRATVLRVPSGAVAGQATVEGSADSLTVLIDRLAARLLLAEAGEDERLGSHMTASLPALRAYLLGQAAFRQSDYATAVRQYELALGRDSAFALDGLRLAIAAERIDDVVRERRGLHIAWAFREALPERDRATLTALAGSRYPAPTSARTHSAEWALPSELAPTSAESWYLLGARLFHDGAVAGVADASTRAALALERALLVDSTYAAAAQLLSHLAIGGDTMAVLTASIRRLADDDSLNPLAPFTRWRSAVSRGDTVELRALRARLSRFGPVNLRAIAMASQFDAVGLDDGTRALELLRARGGTRPRSVDLVLGEHSMALNRGRIRDALEVTKTLPLAQGATNADARLRVLDGLYGDGDTAAARTAAESLDRTTRDDAAAALPGRVADLCVLGQWLLATGKVGEAAGIATELRQTTSNAAPVPVGAQPAACADLLEASVAVVTRRADAASRLARLDSLALTPEVIGDAAAYAALWVARLHQRLGDPAGALVAIRRRQYMADWPRYLAATLREEGRLAEAAGDASGAKDAYERYLALRTDPDPTLGAQAAEVRRAAERLSAAAEAR